MVQNINVLQARLSYLVMEKNKKLTDASVIRASQQLDKLVVQEMKEKNGMTK